MIEVERRSRRSVWPALAEGNGGDFALVPGAGAKRVGEVREPAQQIRADKVGGCSEFLADEAFQRFVQAWTDLLVEGAICELFSVQRDELAPLIAATQHVCEKTFDIARLGVTVQQELFKVVTEHRIGAAHVEQRALSSELVDGAGIVGGGIAAAGAGNEGQAAGELRAEAVDRADVQLPGIFEQVPASGAVTGKGGLGELAGRAIEGAGV